MNRLRRTLCMILSLVLILCAASSLAAVEAHAWSATVKHGDIYASDLEGVDTLCIDGNSKIILQDGDDVTIKCISFTYNDNSGNRELIIEGSNAGTLRITGSDAEYGFIQMGVYSDLFIKGGHIIVGGDNISSGTMIGPGGLLQMEDGILEVKGNRSTSSGDLYGINVERLQIFSKAILNVDVTGNGNASAVVAQSINLSGGHVILNAYTSGTGKSANGIGTASSTDGTIGISGGYVSINANAPYGSGYGIYTLYNEDSRNYLTLDGGSINIYGSAYGIHTRKDNDVNIRGDAVVTVTAGKNCALLCGGNLDIRGQAVLKASVRSTSGLWSTYGTVYSKDYGYIDPRSSKVVTPAGGKLTEQYSGDDYVCSFITDSLGNKAQNVVVGPITNNDALAANKISVGGGRSFTSDELYYVNGAASTTGFTSDWNAHYEPETGTLYLRNYNDRTIYVNNVYNKKLIIDLSGTNTITKANAQFGIDAIGNDLEITSVSGGTLSITGDHQNSNGAGSAAIATNWSGTHERGTITISGDAVLNIDTGSNEEIDGITAEKDLVIKDHAKVDVKISYGDDASVTFYGIGAHGSTTITTDRTVNVSIYSRDSWSSTMSRSIYALWPFNFRSANGDSRFNLLNAEYVSAAYVGKPNEGHAATSHLVNALGNGLVPDYGFKSFEGNDAQSFILSAKGSPSGAIPIVSAYFPDPGFCQIIKEKADTNNDGWLTQGEINSVTSIIYSDASDLDVHSIAGIEQFRNLEHFTWAKGNIRTLELPVNNRQMEHLQTVRVHKNHLEKVDVSGLDDLNGLDINTNKELEWSNILVNPGLQILDASDCGFDSIDISGMTELTMFGCNNNNLTSLDVSQNKKLQMLYCSGSDITPTNRIASLDLTGLTDLEHVECQNNGMNTLILGSHPNLSLLYCYGNNIPTLNIGGAPVIKDAYLNGTHDAGQYFEHYHTEDGNLKIDGTTALAQEYFVMPYGGSLSLEGDIGVNFNVVIPDEVLALPGAYIMLDDLKLPIADAVSLVQGGVQMYQFKYRVAAKEMNREITLRAYTEDGVPIRILRYSSGTDITEAGYKYSVQKYIKAVMNNSSYPSTLVELLKAMSDYGSKAQQQFNYQVSTAASIYNASAISAVTEDDLLPFKRITTRTSREGIKYTSANLTLESETIARVFFDVVSGTIDDYTFKVSGTTVTPKLTADGYAVEIPNIAAKNLDTMYKVQVYDSQGVCLTVDYSALSYAYLVVKNAAIQPQKLVELVKALYIYNQAANAYFGN